MRRLLIAAVVAGLTLGGAPAWAQSPEELVAEATACVTPLIPCTQQHLEKVFDRVDATFDDARAAADAANEIARESAAEAFDLAEGCVYGPCGDEHLAELDRQVQSLCYAHGRYCPEIYYVRQVLAIRDMHDVCMVLWGEYCYPPDVR